MNEAGVRRGRWFQHLFRGEHWTSFVSFRGSSPRRTCPYDGVLASPKAFTLQFKGFRSDKNGPILERSLRFCLHLSCLEVDVVAQSRKRWNTGVWQGPASVSDRRAKTGCRQGSPLASPPHGLQLPPSTVARPELNRHTLVSGSVAGPDASVVTQFWGQTLTASPPRKTTSSPVCAGLPSDPLVWTRPQQASALSSGVAAL